MEDASDRISSLAKATRPQTFYYTEDTYISDIGDEIKNARVFAMKNELQCSWGNLSELNDDDFDKVISGNTANETNAVAGEYPTNQKIYYGEKDGQPLEFWIAGRENQNGEIAYKGETMTLCQAKSVETKKFNATQSDYEDNNKPAVTLRLSGDKSVNRDTDPIEYPTDEITFKKGQDDLNKTSLTWQHRKPGTEKWIEGMPQDIGNYEIRCYAERTNDYERTYSALVLFEVTCGPLPKGMIKIENQGEWSSFTNAIEFANYFEEKIEGISIIAEDEVATVKSVEYAIISVTNPSDAYENEEGIKADSNVISWIACPGGAKSGKKTTYSNITIEEEPGLMVIYVRITDEKGNETYINSGGLVVYKDAPSTVNVNYPEGSSEDLRVPVDFNGNIVNEITELEQNKYRVVDGSAIIFNASCFDGINAGTTRSFTVKYEPPGKKYYNSTGAVSINTTTINVTVVDSNGSENTGTTEAMENYNYWGRSDIRAYLNNGLADFDENGNVTNKNYNGDSTTGESASDNSSGYAKHFSGEEFNLVQP